MLGNSYLILSKILIRLFSSSYFQGVTVIRKAHNKASKVGIQRL